MSRRSFVVFLLRIGNNIATTKTVWSSLPFITQFKRPGDSFFFCNSHHSWSLRAKGQDTIIMNRIHNNIASHYRSIILNGVVVNVVVYGKCWETLKGKQANSFIETDGDVVVSTFMAALTRHMIIDMITRPKPTCINTTGTL